MTTGSWTARLEVEAGSVGDVVLRRPGGASVHALATTTAWSVWDDQGFHDGSRAAGRILHARMAGRPLALEAVQGEKCRPERLFEELGCDDSDLLRAVARWHARRSQQPAVAGPQLNMIGVQTTAGTVKVAVSAESAEGSLARIVAWVDGVPCSTVPVSGRSAQATLAVTLPPWPATIELAAVDAAGVTSQAVWADAPPGAPASARVVAACLGVSKYQDPRLALRFAAKDAVDVAMAMSDVRFGRDPALVRWWIDQDVASDALAAVRAHLAQARTQDLVVLYVADHGLHVRNPLPVWHLLPWGANSEQPERGAISWSSLAGVLDGCKALKRLIILDTCESGEADDDTATGPGLTISGARGLRSRSQQVRIGMVGQWEARDRERLCTADLARTTGAIVLASSRGGESSYESEADANGLFTQCMLDGLRGQADGDGDGRVSSSELAAYVAAAVYRRSDGHQRPTIDRDNPLATIWLPVLPRAE